MVMREILCLVMMLWSRFIVTWQPGIIVEKIGPVSYIVNLHSGSQRRCHFDHIHRWEVLTETSANTQPYVVSSDITSERNDNNTIEILPHAKDSVT